jgi:PGF-pre-PGF domain-containing protein
VRVGRNPTSFGQFIEQPVPPVANFSSNVTEGYAPLSVQFTDLSKNALEWRWDFGDRANSTQQNPVHTYSSAGTYSVNLTVSNAKGTMSKTAPINVLNEDGSSGDNNNRRRSGGSGNIGSPELRDNIESKELSQAYVISGQHVKFDFPKNATPIVYIAFDAKRTPGKTTTIVEMLNKKSILVSDLPSDEIYKSVNIWAGNNGFITPSNIENAVICFKVEKSWIKDNSISQSSVILSRYSNQKWNQLPTSSLDEDDKYLYFIAHTPGFSPFAITGITTATGNEIQPAKESKTHSEIEATIQVEPNNESIEKSNGSTVVSVEPAHEKQQSPKTPAEKNTEIPNSMELFGFVCLTTVFFICLYSFFTK